MCASTPDDEDGRDVPPEDQAVFEEAVGILMLALDLPPAEAHACLCASADCFGVDRIWLAHSIVSSAPQPNQVEDNDDTTALPDPTGPELAT